MNSKKAKGLRLQTRQRCVEADIPLRTNYVRVTPRMGQRAHKEIPVTDKIIGPKGGMIRSPRLDAEGKTLVYQIPSVTWRLGTCYRGVYQRVKRAVA